MPLLEEDALFLTSNFDQFDAEKQTAAKDWLRRYKDQQDEFGLPPFPSESLRIQSDEESFAKMFGGVDKIEYEPLRSSDDPKRDKMQHANMALLSRAYQKQPLEIATRYEFYLNDYSRQKFNKPETDTAGFYSDAAKEMQIQQGQKLVRSRSLDAGFRAAIEGMGSLEKLAAVKGEAEKAADNEVDAGAFLEAYGETQKVMSKHAAFIHETVQAVSAEMDGGDVDLEPLKERLLDIPGTERRIVLAALRMQADKAGQTAKESKGGKFDLFAGKFLQQTGEAAGRLARSAAIDQPRIERLISSIPDTGEVMAPGAIKTAKDAQAYVREALMRSDVAEASAMAAGTGGVGALPVDDNRTTITLDETAQRLIQDAKEREMKRLRVANEIRSIGEAADPIPNVFASTIGTSGAALALMAGTRGLAAPALASAYTNIEFNDLSLKYPQMSTADKTQIAAISGAAQAALDFVGVKALDKLPGIKSLIAQPLTKQLAGRALARGAMSFGQENLVEAGQDIATPALMQALKSDVPGFDWEGEQREFWKGRADVAIGLLPLILLGIGAASVNEYRGAKKLLSWNDQLGAAGVVETDRVAVIEAAQSGDMGKAQSLLMEARGRRNPEVAAEYQDAMSQRQTDMSRATAELERLGAMPTIRIDNGIYTVSIGETSTRFKSWEDARDVAQAGMNDLERAQTELVASIADSFMGGTPSFLKGESVEFSPGSETMGAKIERGDLSLETAMEAAIAGGVVKGVTLAEARAIAAEVFGGQNASERAMQFRSDVERIAVLGSNKVEGGLSKSRVFGKGNERSFLTGAEEITEGRLKAGLERGVFTKEQVVRWVQLAEAATGETFLKGSTWDEISASTETAPRALVEAVSRIVTADVLGRMKDGKRVGAGAISRGLDLSDREQSALAAILGAFRKLFRSILETASKLAKARQEGKLGAEYDALFDALTGGTSQLEHDAAAANEADAIANEAIDTSGYSEATPGPNGETFSTRAVPADASKVVQMPDGAQLVGPTTFSIRAYHGTPHKVDKFTTAKIGTGEGAQAYGWGIYFAESEAVAEGYQSRIAGAQWVDKNGRVKSALEIGEAVYEQARKDGYSVKDADELRSYWSAYAQNGGMQNTQGIESIRAVVDGQGIKLKRSGNLYTVELLPDESEFLDWDKPLSEQSEKVKAALAPIIEKLISNNDDFVNQSIKKQAMSGELAASQAYFLIGGELSIAAGDGYPPKLASEAMSKAGIPGIKYLDAGSRGAGDGTRNFVIFDENLVRILEENGKPVETFSLGKVTPAQDAEYLAAVEAGDMEKEQRMVDEAAFDSGLEEWFHGNTKSFGSFSSTPLGVHLGTEDAAKDRLEQTGQTSGVINKFYIDLKNPVKLKYDPGTWQALEVWEALPKDIKNKVEESYEYQISDLELGELKTELQKLGFDGIKYPNAFEGIGDSILVFEEDSQIKSADPVTRDESGKIVPLSQRFNPADNRITFSILEENGKPVEGETFSLSASEIITPENKVADSIMGKPAADIFAEVKKRHGVTRSIYEAGYILPDGTMLDFSGRADAGDFKQGPDLIFRPTGGRDWMKDQRGVDHREIEWQDMPSYKETWEPMVAFLRLGAVRVDANSGMISMHSRAKITAAQASALKSIVVAADGAYIDLEDDARNRSSMQLNGGKWGKVNGLLTRWANGETPQFEGETFSLRPGDFAARMEAKFSLFQAKPELRLAIAQVAKERALRLGAEWIAKGDVIRSAKDIGKEARMREALAYEARMNEYLDGLSENARQTLEFEPSALEDDPLVAAMLDFGKLMSFTTAKKSGKVEAKSGDYDGQPWLPPAWFSKGMGIMPDQMAQAMFDAGMLPDAYTGTLWSELEKRIEATRKDKAAHREAVQAYKAAEKYARDASRAEADQWAENAKKQAGSPKAQRDMLKAALRTLDGILAAAPPEVRARVGGYVKLAGLATDEAMLQEIERRIDKLNVELEKYLKKQAVAEISKLFKKARPDMEAGKKGKGKDADMHALFAAAEAAADMDALAVAGRLADLDARIASGELTAEQEALAMTERGIVELVGDLKNADSGRAFSALDTLRDIYGGAWLKWKIAEIERKERRAGLRQDFIVATGKAGVRTERTKADKVNESLYGKGKAWLLNLSSMREVLAYAFGLDNERVTSLVDAERTASNTYEDANQRLGDEIEGLFTAMAGTRTKGERLRWNLSQRTIKTGKGELSQLEAIQALLMWRQEDGRRHMEGTRDESGKVTSSWSYDQAWIDEIEAALTPEARQVMSFIMGKYAAEWATLNPLYRARYGVNMPHHGAYAPITVTPVQTKAGEVVDPVTGSAVSGGSILTPGSLRTRSRNAIAEPDFRDALQTMILHSRQMEYWKAYYDLAVEMNAVLGNREVMNSVHAKGGKEAANALRQWIDVIGQGGFRDASLRLALFQAGSKLQGRAAGVALLGRMSAILSQSTQLAAASVKMPVTSYLVRLAKLMTGGLGWRDAMRSDFIQRRFKTAPPIVRQAMDSLASAKPNEIQQLSRFFGNVLSGADAFFTSGTYAILLDYHREQGRAAGLTGAELDAYAHTEAERATEQVAQPTRTANRSLAELSNTGPLGKIGWAFASEARQKVALAAHAALNAKNDPVTAAKSAFLTFAIGGLFTQVLKNLLREAKGDDDGEMWSLGRLGYAMTIAPLASAVPFGSAIAGDSNMLSNIQRAIQTLGNDEVDFRDVDAMLSAAGLFNDTAASLAQLSHLGLDLGKILSNAAD